jgi:predicted Zn-dependent protease
MRYYYFLITALIGLPVYSQSPKVKIPENVVYDFSCMEDDEIASFINFSSDLEKELLHSFGDPVTIDEEKECGDSTLAQMQKEGTIKQTGSNYHRIKTILSNITNKISDPRGFEYSIYLLESEELNAFTIGGKIFFTTAMINFCESDDEIACIIGHEIAHNELGHINEGISRLKTAGRFGGIGQMSAAIASLATTSFNQKNEAHCDFFGIDLAYAAGYNGCASTDLWNRMKAQESDKSGLDTFFSSHPFSSKREMCANNHIHSNYKVECQ